MALRLLEPDHPFFRPLWVRILVVAVAIGWGLFEYVLGNPFWSLVFWGLGLYAAWGFFIAAERPRDGKAK